jgi:CubicO group peptidase (beta-lactamase class C family)
MAASAPVRLALFPINTCNKGNNNADQDHRDGVGCYGLLMMNNGKVNNRQIISSSWIREATTAGRDAVAYGTLYEDYPLGYGYQWWLFPGGNFEGQGVYGQFIYVAPAEGVVIINLSAWR